MAKRLIGVAILFVGFVTAINLNLIFGLFLLMIGVLVLSGARSEASADSEASDLGNYGGDGADCSDGGCGGNGGGGGD